jgi:hypothetical protein
MFVSGLDVVLVKIKVYVDGTPATTGVGADTVTIPLNPVALSANVADVAVSETPSTPSVVASATSGIPCR